MQILLTAGRVVAFPLLVAVAAIVAPCTTASAQEPRTVELSRQRHDSLPLQVELDHNGGKLLVHPTAEPLLYRARATYDPSLSEAVYSFDSVSRVLSFGIHRPTTQSASGPRAPQLRLELSNRNPLDIRLNLSSGTADLDLGGLRLNRLAVHGGASASTVHFDTPNLDTMELLDLAVGAASLQLRGLANSRARELRLTVGAGDVELDFGGDWIADMNADFNISLGRVRVRIPADVGVRIEATRVLASFDRAGLTKRGDAWYSPNWDDATHRLRIRSHTALGALDIERGS